MYMYVHVYMYNCLSIDRSELPEFGDQIRVPEQRRVSGIDEDNSYSVFISYAEIYNNFVYDLLDESNVEAGLHPK